MSGCGEVMRKQTHTLAAPPSSSSLIFAACRLAVKYAHRTPTIADLIEGGGMSRATAYRWLAAIKAAKGEA